MAKHMYVKNTQDIDCFEPGKPICRGCLITDQSLENAKPLEVFFRELTGISISDSDGIPHWFCNECAALLRKYAKFRQKVINSHNMLSKFLFEGVMLEKEINDILEEINESDIPINTNIGNKKVIEKQIANASTTDIDEDVINMTSDLENKDMEQVQITHTVGNDDHDIDMPDLSDFINEEIKELINKSPVANIEMFIVTSDENTEIKENDILSGKEDNNLQKEIWDGCQVQVTNVLQEEPIEISAVKLNHNKIIVPEEVSIHNNSETESAYPSLGVVELVTLDNTNTENVVPVQIIEEHNDTSNGDPSVSRTKSPNLDLSTFFDLPANLLGSPSDFSYESSMSDIVDFDVTTATINDVTKAIEMPVCTGISGTSAANEIELQMTEDTYTTLKTVLDEIELEQYVQNIPEKPNSDNAVLNNKKIHKEVDRYNMNKNTLIPNECDVIIDYIQESYSDKGKNLKKTQLNSVNKVHSKSKNMSSIHKLFKSRNHSRPQFTNKVLKKSDHEHKSETRNSNVLKKSDLLYKNETKNINVSKTSQEVYKIGTKNSNVLKKSDELHKIRTNQTNVMKKIAEAQTFGTKTINFLKKSDEVHKIGTNNNNILTKSAEGRTFVIKNSNVIKKSDELHGIRTRNDKVLKITDKAHENSSKIMLLLKNMNGCTCKKFRCPEKFTEERKKAIFHDFWALGNIVDRRSYIIRHIKWRYVSSVQSGKSHGHKQATDFFFELDANNTTLITRVCQDFFLNTLGIPMTFVETALRKSNAIEGLQDKARKIHTLLYL